MHHDFKIRYAERGRGLNVLGSPVEAMEPEELHAVIGFLLEHLAVDAEVLLAQEMPLGAPRADPPKNDGLLEG